MKENEFAILGKFSATVLIVIIALSALINILRGHVPHPEAFGLVILGFVLFLLAKLSVMRKTLVSFGTGLMTENMANVYRLGYWLMALGLLCTFA